MTTRTSLRDNGKAMRRRLFGDDDGAPAIMRTLNREARLRRDLEPTGARASRTAWFARSPRSAPCSG